MADKQLYSLLPWCVFRECRTKTLKDKSSPIQIWPGRQTPYQFNRMDKSSPIKFTGRTKDLSSVYRADQFYRTDKSPSIKLKGQTMPFNQFAGWKKPFNQIYITNKSPPIYLQDEQKPSLLVDRMDIKPSIKITVQTKASHQFYRMDKIFPSNLQWGQMPFHQDFRTNQFKGRQKSFPQLYRMEEALLSN